MLNRVKKYFFHRRNWSIDSATKHKIIRLSPAGIESYGFYFHNNPFLKTSDGKSDLMLFYILINNKLQYTLLNLQTRKYEILTNEPQGVATLDKQRGVVNASESEIVDIIHREIIYQIDNHVFATNIDTKNKRLIISFPKDSDMAVKTLNADCTLLAGTYSEGGVAGKTIQEFAQNREFVNKVYNAHFKHYLFTFDLKTNEIKIVHEENAWLNHLQFSPTNPNLLLYCHEGPWHEVNRIWTINLETKEIRKIHQRSMDMEIAGHEFWATNGKTIWYDLQQPRGERFFLCGADVETGKQTKYELQRDEFSIHYNTLPDETAFCGDGSEGRISKGTDGKWIYLFRKINGRLVSDKLANLINHKYHLEPNVHFSPNGKMVIFTTNMNGNVHIYAVNIKKSNILWYLKNQITAFRDWIRSI
jgi:oligogalacturonide lyase